MDLDKKIFTNFQVILLRTGGILCGVIFLLEVAMKFYFNSLTFADTSILPPALYSIFFILIPSTINFSAFIAAYLVCKSNRFTSKQKNYAVILMYAVISTSICTIHYYFTSIFSAFVVVIFISTLFQDIKMTTIVYGLSFISLFGSVLYANYEHPEGIMNLWQNTMFSAIILYLSFVLARVIIRLQVQREKAIIQDNLEKNLLKEKLLYDPLTKLHSEESFFKILTEKCEIEANENSQYQLALVDIDNYLNYVAHYGLDKTNDLVKKVSQMIVNNISSSAIVSRCENKRFAVLFTGQNLRATISELDSLHHILKNYSFDFNGETEYVTISCGVANFEISSSHTSLYEKASQALYKAKADGKDKTIAEI